MTPAKKILIVEDEAVIAFEMADVVQDLGFEVVGLAIRLDDALVVAKEADFHVACLDVNLGRGQTSEPITRVLKDRGIPYIFISANTLSQIDFACPDDIVVAKPVCVSALRQALSKIAA